MKILFNIFFALIISVLCVPSMASAAVFFLEVPTDLSRNEEVLATVKIDTQGQSINALSGEIRIPDEFEIVRLLDGNSSVVLWIEKPGYTKEAQIITFSGLTPGGINGTRPLFSFIAKSAKAGNYALRVSSAVAYKNDGEGTLVGTTSPITRLSVNSTLSTSTIAYDDELPPDFFVPEVTSSPDLFGNQKFITFTAQDKGVGIDRYEFASAHFGKPGDSAWKVITSPFQLPDELHSKKIYIKAVDKLGNERIVSVVGPNYYGYRIMWGIIIAIAIICGLFTVKRFLR